MRHLVIPDTQVKSGVCINHLQALGSYIADLKPEVIVCLGDWCDFHSLSTYDRGKKEGEGARYAEDIAASKRAMDVLFKPIKDLNVKARRNKEKMYRPKQILTLGNHENRLNRHIDANPVLDGHLSMQDLGYEDYGWDVHDFLEVVEQDGILYSHYFPRNAQGRIVQTFRGSPSAALQVVREGQSCTSGHLQGLDIHYQQRGTRLDLGIIAGSCYLHEEKYLSSQGTAYWRGVIVKNEVKDGYYDPMPVSLRYLLDKWWDGKERTA